MGRIHKKRLFLGRKSFKQQQKATKYLSCRLQQQTFTPMRTLTKTRFVCGDVFSDMHSCALWGRVFPWIHIHKTSRFSLFLSILWSCSRVTSTFAKRVHSHWKKSCPVESVLSNWKYIYRMRILWIFSISYHNFKLIGQRLGPIKWA